MNITKHNFVFLNVILSDLVVHIQQYIIIESCVHHFQHSRSATEAEYTISRGKIPRRVRGSNLRHVRFRYIRSRANCFRKTGSFFDFFSCEINEDMVCAHQAKKSVILLCHLRAQDFCKT